MNGTDPVFSSSAGSACNWMTSSYENGSLADSNQVNHFPSKPRSCARSEYFA